MSQRGRRIETSGRTLLTLVVQSLDALDFAEIGGHRLEHLARELHLERARRTTLHVTPHARRLRRRRRADGAWLHVVAAVGGINRPTTG